MSQTRDRAVTAMEEMLAAFEAKLTPPVLTAKGARRVFRYEDKSAPQAIVQKIARVVSGIRAVDILMERGYLQEGAALIRVVSEMIEDIRFLSKAIITRDASEFLKTYLRVFYEEAIPGDDDVITELNRKRTRISRRQVRDADARYNDEVKIPPKELPTAQLPQGSRQPVLGVRSWELASDHGHVRRKPPSLSRGGDAGHAPSGRLPKVL